MARIEGRRLHRRGACRTRGFRPAGLREPDRRRANRVAPASEHVGRTHPVSRSAPVGRGPRRCSNPNCRVNPRVAHRRGHATPQRRSPCVDYPTHDREEIEMRFFVKGFVATAAALIVAATAAGAGSPKTFSVYLPGTKSTYVDVGRHGYSPGDYFLATGQLLTRAGGEQIGGLAGVWTLRSPA